MTGSKLGLFLFNSMAGCDVQCVERAKSRSRFAGGIHRLGWRGGVLLGCIVFAVGCGGSSSDIASRRSLPKGSDSQSRTASEVATTDKSHPEMHGHEAGVHGGIMVSLGRDNYHVEVVFEADGGVHLYMLGQDETRVIDVEVQTLKGFVKEQEASTAQSIMFEAQPQVGDAANRTSHFAATIPSDLLGKSLDVTIPNIVIDGERFRLGFKSSAENHSAKMPDRMALKEEQELYLTPAGKYTAVDIAANGGLMASEKFKGIPSNHDLSPKSGDKICPITKTKANPQFTWIADGKSYQFCCPPCIDEFVKQAKTSVNELLDPAEYVKQ